MHPRIAISLSRSGIVDGVVGLGRVFDSLEEADRVLDLDGSAGTPSGMTTGASTGSAMGITGVTRDIPHHLCGDGPEDEDEGDEETGSDYWSHGNWHSSHGHDH